LWKRFWKSEFQNNFRNDFPPQNGNFQNVVPKLRIFPDYGMFQNIVPENSCLWKNLSGIFREKVPEKR